MQDIPTTLHAKLCEHSYTLNSKNDIMVFCNNCGTENPDDVKFCSNCGTALKSISDEAAAIFDKDRERDYEPASTPRPTETLEGKEVKKTHIRRNSRLDLWSNIWFTWISMGYSIRFYCRDFIVSDIGSSAATCKQIIQRKNES